MLNYKLNLIKTKITDFIKNKKASDDKNTGTAMSMIFAVVIGLLLITSIYAFLNNEFLPAVFDKIKNTLNYSG